MNWIKIQNDYPKAWAKFKDFNDRNFGGDLDLYYVDKFFDINDIYINVAYAFSGEWTWHIDGFNDEICEGDVYESRSKCEFSAFEKAFEILQSNLYAEEAKKDTICGTCSYGTRISLDRFVCECKDKREILRDKKENIINCSKYKKC